MDIVIPLGKGSQNSDLELRYCLRSIEKNMTDRGNVFVICERPAFLHNVIHIPATDINERQWKQRNICNKLLLACDDKRVSDDFVWVSDDHVLLEPFYACYYYSASLRARLQGMTEHQTYRNTLTNTLLKLEGGNYYCHCPMVFNKEKFKKAMAVVDWNIPFGFAIKSLYCGLNGIEGDMYRDLKIRIPLITAHIQRMIRDRLFFSYSNEGFNKGMQEVLDLLFPNKSSYEL